MKRILLIMLAALMVFSLVACGEKKEDSSDTSSAVTSSDTDQSKDAAESKEADESKKPDDADDAKDTDASKDAKDAKDADDSDSAKTSSKKYATLKECLDDPNSLTGIDEVKKASSDVLDIDVKADGNVLVYDYTYRTQVDESMLPSVKATLDKSLEATESTFVTLADTLQSQIEEDIEIKVVYRNADSEIITEKTFEPSK